MNVTDIYVSLKESLSHRDTIVTYLCGTDSKRTIVLNDN